MEKWKCECGHENEAEAKFCAECGAKHVVEDAPEAPAADKGKSRVSEKEKQLSEELVETQKRLLKLEKDVAEGKRSESEVKEIGDKVKDAITESLKAMNLAPAERKAEPQDLGELDAPGIQRVINSDEELRYLNDRAFIVANALFHKDRTGRTFAQVMRETESFKLLQEALGKQMYTTASGAGSEWIPTQFSGEVIPDHRLALSMIAEHRHVPMPTKVYTSPLIGSANYGYYVSESTGSDIFADPSSILRDMNTSNVSLTARILKYGTVFSEELTEDSIIPIVPEVRADMLDGLKRTLESAAINGDRTDGVGSHFDSNVTAATDRRHMIDGLRYEAKKSSDGGETDISSFYADTIIPGVKGKCGSLGIDPAGGYWLTSVAGFYKMLTLRDNSDNKQPAVQTLDKFGPMATYLTGYLAAFAGSPVLVSAEVPQNLNACGEYDGVTTSKTILLYVPKKAWRFGDRREVTVESTKSIGSGQYLMVVTMRTDFVPVYTQGSDKRNVGVGINMPTS